jgi:hypothetical protein
VELTRLKTGHAVSCQGFDLISLIALDPEAEKHRGGAEERMARKEALKLHEAQSRRDGNSEDDVD